MTDTQALGIEPEVSAQAQPPAMGVGAGAGMFSVRDMLAAQPKPESIVRDFMPPINTTMSGRQTAARKREEALVLGQGVGQPTSTLDLVQHPDFVQRGAAAGLLDVYASGQPHGVGAAIADVKTTAVLAVEGARWNALHTKFQNAPTSMSTPEAEEYLGLLGQLGDATDWAVDEAGEVADRSPEGDRVVRAVFGESGLRVDMEPATPARAAAFAGAVDPDVVPYTPSAKGRVASVTNGKTTLRAPVTVPTIVEHRILYPALRNEGGESAIWTPSEPEFVGDGEAYRSAMAALDRSVEVATYLSTTFNRVGGHPGLTPGQRVMLTVADDFPLQRLAKMGTVTDLGGVGVETLDREDDLRMTRRSRRVLLEVPGSDPKEVGDIADASLALGALKARLYTNGHPGESWHEAREYLHRDGVSVSSTITAPKERTASNGITIWTQEAVKNRPVQVPITVKPLGPGYWAYGGARVLGDPNASPHEDLSKFTLSGARATHVAVDPSTAQVQLGFGAAPPGVVARSVKGGLLFEPEDSNVGPIARATAVLRAAGVPASRLAVRIQGDVLRLV